jgi:HAE1 family hydrophobic/amphiphilic exporter-1/multidrug efflux pump
VFGMSFATMIGIFIIPVFYVVMQSLAERLRRAPAPAPQPS